MKSNILEGIRFGRHLSFWPYKDDPSSSPPPGPGDGPHVLEVMAVGTQDSVVTLLTEDDVKELSKYLSRILEETRETPEDKLGKFPVTPSSVSYADVDCATCKHESLPSTEAPCCGCRKGVNGMTTLYWDPKVKLKETPTCSTCRYESLPSSLYPCRSCSKSVYSPEATLRWEPKPREPASSEKKVSLPVIQERPRSCSTCRYRLVNTEFEPCKECHASGSEEMSTAPRLPNWERDPVDSPRGCVTCRAAKAGKKNRHSERCRKCTPSGLSNYWPVEGA